MTQVVAVIAESFDGGGILSDEMLNMLEVATLSSGECDSFISLNAITRTQTNQAIHHRALIKN
jgi:hypothetical protein